MKPLKIFPLLVIISIIFINCKNNDDDSPPPALPIAAFSVDKTTTEPGQTISFTNESQNAISYEWNFDDGRIELNETNPSHTYSSEGTFNVTLKATGDGGTDETSRTIVVEVPSPIADFTMDPTMAGAGEAITFTNNSLNADAYLWEFGDGETSEYENTTHTYMADDNYTIKLTAYGNNKENSISKTIKIETDYDGDWKATATETGSGLNSSTVNFSVNGNDVSISSFNANTDFGFIFGSNWDATLMSDNSFSFAPNGLLEYNIQLETANTGSGIVTFNNNDYAMAVTRQ